VNAKSKLGFVAATAEATGTSKTTVKRAVRRGTALGAETLTHIKGSSLDKGV
jgi:hypothetical protein